MGKRAQENQGNPGPLPYGKGSPFIALSMSHCWVPAAVARRGWRLRWGGSWWTNLPMGFGGSSSPRCQPTIPGNVIGWGHRDQVHNTTTYPYRAVEELVTTFPNGGTGGCTGWFIGPRVVATAGHCVYTHYHSTGRATSIKVYAGRDGSTKSYNYSNGQRFFTVSRLEKLSVSVRKKIRRRVGDGFSSYSQILTCNRSI